MWKIDTHVTINGTEYKITPEQRDMFRLYKITGEIAPHSVRSFASRKEAFDHIYTLTLQD